MISTETKVGSKGRFFVIQPNASLSLRGAKILFLVVCILTLLVVARFVFLGAWMVIPFSIIEVLFFGFILKLVMKNNRQVELISVTEEAIKVIRLAGEEREEWSFHPYWAQIILEPSHHDWYPSRLVIRSHGQEIALAECLTETERVSLAETLIQSLVDCKTSLTDNNNE